MSKQTKAQIAEREEAKSELLKLLKPGQTVYTKLEHVSRSGMMRHISLCIVEDGDIRDITYLASIAMNDSRDKKSGGIKIGGAGMDMGFALVYNLGATLWPKGTPKPHGTRNGEPDTSGGYALKHRWL